MLFNFLKLNNFFRIRYFKKGENRVDIEEYDINVIGTFDSGKNLKVYLDKQKSDLHAIVND